MKKGDARLIEPEGVEFDPAVHQLTFDACFRTHGGSHNETVRSMCAALSGSLNGPNLLILQDVDTYDSDEAITPYFLGPTPRDRAQAQVDYAFALFEEFALKPLGSNVIESLRAIVAHLPLQTEGAAA